MGEYKQLTKAGYDFFKKEILPDLSQDKLTELRKVSMDFLKYGQFNLSNTL